MSKQEFTRLLPPRKPRPRPVWHKRPGRNNRRAYTGGPSQASKQMLAILTILSFQGRYRMYEGSVPAAVKAKRRAKNKVARISRRANRNG